MVVLEEGSRGRAAAPGSRPRPSNDDHARTAFAAMEAAKPHTKRKVISHAVPRSYVPADPLARSRSSSLSSPSRLRSHDRPLHRPPRPARRREPLPLDLQRSALSTLRPAPQARPASGSTASPRLPRCPPPRPRPCPRDRQAQVGRDLMLAARRRSRRATGPPTGSRRSSLVRGRP